MRRESSRRATKKWSPASLRFHLTRGVRMSAILLTDLKPLVDACAREPGELAYIVLARVVNRSKADFIERRDVTPEALAAFLPLRDAAVAVTDRQLAEAALAWIRSAIGDALGDRESTKIKVTIWRPKGLKTLVSLRVKVGRAPAPAVEETPPVPSPVLAATKRARTGTFISLNGPTWRAIIAEAEAAGEPVSDLVRSAARIAEEAEREGVPQLPVSREAVEALRRRAQRAPVAASSAAPTLSSANAGPFLLAGRSAAQRADLTETELEHALYGIAGRSLVGLAAVGVELSKVAVDVLGAVAQVVTSVR